MQVRTFVIGVATLVVSITLVDLPLLAIDVHMPDSTHNLLLDAKVSGNLPSFNKGLRGQPNHVVYDIQQRGFPAESTYHEYGVGFDENLGIVPEESPAYWMAEWDKPINVNLIVLSGVYPNQPQPQTCWKIELRQDGRWTVHARGKGGWYDQGRYVWGGKETKVIQFDALRVSLFSADKDTPLKSVLFRGEQGVSWVVAEVAPIDARIVKPKAIVRVGQEATFKGEPIAGKIKKWRWQIDGRSQVGSELTHRFSRAGVHDVALSFSDGKYQATVKTRIEVAPPVAARITPLGTPVMVGKPCEFDARGSVGQVSKYTWDFGDGHAGERAQASHTFEKPGIFKVQLTVADENYRDQCLAIVRVCTPETLNVPQVLLDSDQKNEQDDQHYFGYALFSELDVLGINSVHHGGGQEPVNYKEILHVLELARKSGLPSAREPFVFRGANERLRPSRSRKWYDTEPIVTSASQAISAVARGASPSHPVWVVPVGPGTNVASAVLQARREGLELKNRIRIMWLGGSDHAVTQEFNGNNDPWSIYVIAQSDVETWFMPAPVGARVSIDKRTEGDLYAKTPLGRYLKQIVPPRKKALYDPACLSAIISLRLGLDWVKETERISVDSKDGHPWHESSSPDAVRVIRQIDARAMQRDIFNTIKGMPTRLIGQ